MPLTMQGEENGAEGTLNPRWRTCPFNPRLLLPTRVPGRVLIYSPKEDPSFTQRKDKDTHASCFLPRGEQWWVRAAPHPSWDLPSVQSSGNL